MNFLILISFLQLVAVIVIGIRIVKVVTGKSDISVAVQKLHESSERLESAINQNQKGKNAKSNPTTTPRSGK